MFTFRKIGISAAMLVAVFAVFSLVNSGKRIEADRVDGVQENQRLEKVLAPRIAAEQRDIDAKAAGTWEPEQKSAKGLAIAAGNLDK